MKYLVTVQRYQRLRAYTEVEVEVPEDSDPGIDELQEMGAELVMSADSDDEFTWEEDSLECSYSGESVEEITDG